MSQKVGIPFNMMEFPFFFAFFLFLFIFITRCVLGRWLKRIVSANAKILIFKQLTTLCVSKLLLSGKSKLKVCNPFV